MNNHQQQQQVNNICHCSSYIQFYNHIHLLTVEPRAEGVRESHQWIETNPNYYPCHKRDIKRLLDNHWPAIFYTVDDSIAANTFKFLVTRFEERQMANRG